LVVSILLLVFVVLVPMQCRIVRPGERGVVTTWGKIEPNVWTEGLHLKRAFSQKVIKVDVKTQKLQGEVGAASKDLQEVKAEVALNFHVDPLKVNALIQQIGRDYERVVVAPAISEMVKAATAKYTAEELITKRDDVKQHIRAALTVRLMQVFLVVDEVSIVNFDFSAQFNKAIEEKQTAAQNAIKASRDLDRIKIEAEQRVVQAKAESESSILQAQAAAESLRLQRSVITPELVKLRAIEKWNGVLPTYSGGGAIPFIDVK
jgi:regulator of protease activity HflC (stomatin/prohibitin superfamily)